MGLDALAHLYFIRYCFDSCEVVLYNFLMYVVNIIIEALNSPTSDAAIADVFRSTLILCARMRASNLSLGLLMTQYRASRANSPITIWGIWPTEH